VVARLCREQSEFQSQVKAKERESKEKLSFISKKNSLQIKSLKSRIAYLQQENTRLLKENNN
jgi:hypothetical protein